MGFNDQESNDLTRPVYVLTVACFSTSRDVFTVLLYLCESFCIHGYMMCASARSETAIIRKLSCLPSCLICATVVCAEVGLQILYVWQMPTVPTAYMPGPFGTAVLLYWVLHSILDFMFGTCTSHKWSSCGAAIVGCCGLLCLYSLVFPSSSLLLFQLLRRSSTWTVCWHQFRWIEQGGPHCKQV